MNKNSKIILHGCYHNQNYGDQLMADILAQFILDRTGITPICPWLNVDEAEHHTAIRGNGLTDCQDASFAIMGGGGYLEAPTSSSIEALNRYLEPARIWKESGTPYVIAGVGVGPHIEGKGKEYVREICEGAEKIAVRDEQSRNILLGLGLESNKVITTADLVLGLERSQIPEWANEQADLLLGDAGNSGAKLIGIHAPLGASHSKMTSDILKLFADNFSGRSEFKIVCFDDAPSNTKHSVGVAEAAIPGVSFIGKQSHWVTAALIAKMSAIFSVKLHVGITSWALGVPCFSLSVHQKTERFYTQVQRGDFQDNLMGLVSNNHKIKRGLMRFGLLAQPRLAPQQKALLEAWLPQVSDPGSAFYNDDKDLRSEIKHTSNLNYKVIDDFLSGMSAT